MMDICYLCLRITAKDVLKHAHNIFDKKIAREIGLEASSYIKKAYEKNRVIFCGQKTSLILASLFYVLGVNRCGITQNELSHYFNTSENCLRQKMKLWGKLFPELQKIIDTRDFTLIDRKALWKKHEFKTL